MAKYLMAMDAGTGSVRAVIFSTEGDQVGCVQKEWTHNEDPRWPGSMDFDWTTNWELARTCVSEVLAKTGIDASDIAAVSTTCMREGILLYDKDGALPRLLWVKNKMPEVYEKTARIGMFNDWLIYKLTGELAVEPSNGSTTGIMSLETRNWDPSIAERCGLRTDIFGPVKESGELAGTVSAKVATASLA